MAYFLNGKINHVMKNDKKKELTKHAFLSIDKIIILNYRNCYRTKLERIKSKLAVFKTNLS